MTRVIVAAIPLVNGAPAIDPRWVIRRQAGDHWSLYPANPRTKPLARKYRIDALVLRDVDGSVLLFNGGVIVVLRGLVEALKLLAPDLTSGWVTFQDVRNATDGVGALGNLKLALKTKLVGDPDTGVTQEVVGTLAEAFARLPRMAGDASTEVDDASEIDNAEDVDP